VRMKVYTCLLLMVFVAVAASAGDLPRPDAKTSKTTLIATCSKCDKVVTNTVSGKDVRCHGGYSVTNGVMSQYTATVKCPRCKEKFSTEFEQFTKAPPKAVVVPTP